MPASPHSLPPDTVVTWGSTMLAVVHSVATIGIEGHPVRVEVQVGSGVPAFTLVGLPDAAVREARERVRAAIVASGFVWPLRKITVNLAPAGLPKQGSWYDLPIALAVLAGAEEIPSDWARDHVVVGELGLDGAIRSVPGVLSAALAGRREGRVGVVVPAGNAAEAHAVDGLAVVAAGDLRQFREGLPASPDLPAPEPEAVPDPPDLGDVAGQETAKFALEVAAAGGHHCLLVGEPGSGKTMLARRVPGILPPLGQDERIAVSLLHSLAGIGRGLVGGRPFRSPHHSASVNAMVGGGSAHVTPGEISLAHAGVLLMDEFGEFRPSVLDALRQPLQDGEVSISRRAVRVRFPARFMLVAASNPCPCGYLGSARRPCTCDYVGLARYRRRMSGPLMDRIDICVPVHVEDPDVVLGHEGGRESPGIRARVVDARGRQADRQGEAGTNAALDSADLREFTCITPEAASALRGLAGAVSSRALASLQKVARTVADLEGEDRVEARHVHTAWRLRMPAFGDLTHTGGA